MHEAYHRAVDAKDVNAIMACMAEDIRMHSPTKMTPFEGKGMVRFLFGNLMQVLEDFAFTHVDSGPGTATLHFRCTIGGRAAEGVDILHFDADGLIRDFKVAIRPLPALAKLNEVMGERLAAVMAANDSGGSGV